MTSLVRARALALSFATVLAVLGGSARELLGTCGPFTDVAADTFCPFVLEIFYLGITTGTTATTYDPAGNVSRLQMAAFLSRSVDGIARRGSRRTVLGQLGVPQSADVAALATVALPVSAPALTQCGATGVWVEGSNGITQVTSDGKAAVPSPITGQPAGLLLALGRIWLTDVSNGSGNALFAYSTADFSGVAKDVPSKARSLAFDGARIFSADISGSLTIVTLSPASWQVSTVTAGFTQPWGTLFDGANIWVTDLSAAKLLKVGADGTVLQTVTVGAGPSFPVFDGANIWTPNSGAGTNSISVVRASTGAVLATLTGNGVQRPATAAFDGERILVTNQFAGTVSLFKAADLSPLGSIDLGGGFPYGACSDGLNFWISLNTGNKLVRF